MTEEQLHNEEVFNEILAKADPELWRIKQALNDTKINPMIVPFVIEAIHEIAFIHGHGSVEIYISKGNVQNLKANSNIKVELEALLRG